MTFSAPPPHQQWPPPMSTPPPPPGAPRPRRGGFAAAVLAGALVVGGGAGLGGAALWSAIDDGNSSADSGASTSVPLQVADGASGDAPAGSVEQVAKAVLPSVVSLDVSSGGTAGSGSGVVLTQDGLILTNNHVVTLAGAIAADGAKITVSFSDGSTATGTVVGTDPLTDTALVQAEDVSGKTPISIGKSTNLDVGEQVVAIGSPYGLDSTVTSGIVSALDRPVEVGRDDSGNTTAYPAIQTDAAINHGNSGGALVNMQGQLVGINASIQTAEDGNADGGSIGIGFAIPIDEVVPIVEQLRNGDTPTHARLGIEVQDADGGAAVHSIEDGSAASEAGLREGDVITKVDDHAVDSSGALVATVRSYRPNDSVTVTYVRDGQTRTTRLALGSDAT
ncbi:PDZ domain-containing protein [Nocardioides humilatus]|uniref:PDZ domain-containing protein n=1 Tax=Nocardioides humilatus TaxID=2607660 RepID=A0A5B1LNZ0_9ACTN|nr:trypsin-like peptidase domain-containing protein [Nocardioides humilatus]KAA1421317.1 PDZ domain-containing protein [Nocardioides humilatus]